MKDVRVLAIWHDLQIRVQGQHQAHHSEYSESNVIGQWQNHLQYSHVAVTQRTQNVT